jgi:serine/threonine protein kinase
VEAACLLETLARALHHVHANGIVHRNLKPKVVLLAPPPEGTPIGGGVSPWGIPKVTSFDLAIVRKDPIREEDQGELIGTPRYMAPEQATGQIGLIGPATDIHALGILLWELLTGEPLFQGALPQTLMEQVIQLAPRPPSVVRPGLPEELDAICLRCLAKEPGQRYSSSASLADDLHRFISRSDGL